MGNLTDRTGERYRAQIRTFYGFREASAADARMLTEWLGEQAASVGTLPDHLTAALEERRRQLLIEPPSADRMERIVRDAINDHEERFCSEIANRLPPHTRTVGGAAGA